MVHKPTFYHVNKLVVAARISRKHKESWIDKIANRIEDDSFHYLAVEKLEPHPDAVDDGCARMEVQVIADRVAIKAVHVKNSLDVLGRNLFNLIRIESANPEDFRSRLWRTAEQILDRVPGGRLQIALEGLRPELDYDLF